ncbi:hypothetical protein BK637_02240 [Pseudomonas chlororaphis]|nr:hypothetical protein BK637_02240 [Pseudomonas chlororaphis]
MEKPLLPNSTTASSVLIVVITSGRFPVDVFICVIPLHRVRWQRVIFGQIGKAQIWIFGKFPGYFVVCIFSLLVFIIRKLTILKYIFYFHGSFPFT